MTIERPMFPPAREIDVIEPSFIQGTFCDTMIRVEHIGPCRQLVFSVINQGDPGRPFREVCAKLIVPADLLPAIAAQLLQHVPGSAAVLATAARDGATAH